MVGGVARWERRQGWQPVTSALAFDLIGKREEVDIEEIRLVGHKGERI